MLQTARQNVSTLNNLHIRTKFPAETRFCNQWPTFVERLNTLTICNTDRPREGFLSNIGSNLVLWLAQLLQFKRKSQSGSSACCMVIYFHLEMLIKPDMFCSKEGIMRSCLR